jgi:hypothetical protein
MTAQSKFYLVSKYPGGLVEESIGTNDEIGNSGWYVCSREHDFQGLEMHLSGLKKSPYYKDVKIISEAEYQFLSKELKDS